MFRFHLLFLFLIPVHRPGGKYGPKVEEISKEEGQQLAVGEELKRAAEVVKASLKVRQR